MPGAVAHAKAEPGEWLTSWAAAPQPPTPQMGPIPATSSFSDQTVVQIVKVSAGGAKVRIRLSNEYGSKPLVIGGARIGLADTKGGFQAGSDHALTFGGENTVTIPAGAPMLSDPLDWPVSALSTLAIRLYLPEETGQCTCHGTGIQTAWVAAGDQTKGASLSASATTLERAFVTAVEVDRAKAGQGIVVLGDSISDGLGSTVDSNQRWPDILATRLAARGAAQRGVANMGISGNRLLNRGTGDNALARFDRDVLSQPGTRYLIVFMGINDIGSSHIGGLQGPMAQVMKDLFPGRPVSATEMIEAYRQIIGRAHARGMKVYGATITPFEGALLYSDAAEAQRQAVNHWIRTSSSFDAVLDFDAVWRDPSHPTRIREGFHSGDHLHGSDAGYKALAESIDISLFQ